MLIVLEVIKAGTGSQLKPYCYIMFQSRSVPKQFSK